jgi:hypothetical protein
VTSQHDPHRHAESGVPRWAVVTAALILGVAVILAGIIYLSREGGDSPIAASAHSGANGEARTQPQPLPSQPETRTLTPPEEAAAAGSRAGSAAFLAPGADASFNALAASMTARVGLAVAPLGGGGVREFGDLREGHAWSSIKVPILATLMREQGESLDSEEEALAMSAITASDNEAVEALFNRLEGMDGGLDGASRAVEGTLRAAGDTTTAVSTSPPPAGAVSTYGQTEWSLLGSAQFYRSLANGCLLAPPGTEYVEGLMESVIPEQRWGLGEAGFRPGWSVGMKGGWGPEASSGGAYLVRQSGFVREGDRGMAVAMIAMDESGTYPAGASDLTQIAQWLAGELKGLGPPSSRCAGP